MDGVDGVDEVDGVDDVDETGAVFPGSPLNFLQDLFGELFGEQANVGVELFGRAVVDEAVGETEDVGAVGESSIARRLKEKGLI